MKENTSDEIVPQKEEDTKGLHVGNKERNSKKGPMSVVNTPGGFDSFLNMWDIVNKFFFDIHYNKQSELHTIAPFELQGIAEVKKRLSSKVEAAANQKSRWKNRIRRAAHNSCCRRAAQIRALSSVLWQFPTTKNPQQPLSTIKMPLVNVLADMELTGIGVDMGGCIQSRYMPEDIRLTRMALMKCVIQTWLLAANSLLEMMILHLPLPYTAKKYHVENLYEAAVQMNPQPLILGQQLSSAGLQFNPGQYMPGPEGYAVPPGSIGWALGPPAEPQSMTMQHDNIRNYLRGVQLKSTRVVSHLFKSLDSFHFLLEPLATMVNVLADMELSGIGVDMGGCIQSRYMLGKKYRKCDPNGPVMFYVSKMIPTSNESGHFFAFGGVFSSIVSPSMKVFSSFAPLLKIPMFDKNGGVQALSLMFKQLWLPRRPWKDTAYMMEGFASFTSLTLDTLIVSRPHLKFRDPFLIEMTILTWLLMNVNNDRSKDYTMPAAVQMNPQPLILGQQPSSAGLQFNLGQYMPSPEGYAVPLGSSGWAPGPPAEPQSMPMQQMHNHPYMQQQGMPSKIGPEPNHYNGQNGYHQGGAPPRYHQ
nr:helicase and polymerase-containing protein TEBICHI [Tanacetum cinerariifolium]